MITRSTYGRLCDVFLLQHRLCNGSENEAVELQLQILLTGLLLARLLRDLVCLGSCILGVALRLLALLLRELIVIQRNVLIRSGPVAGTLGLPSL